MDGCKGFIVCKNRIKYSTDVAISSDNGKDVGGSARKICGIEIDIGFIDKPGFVIKRPIFGSS